MMNVMLIRLRAPHNLLGEAILTINYIINKVPHKKLEKIPCEFEKVENLLINISKCKDVLQR
jgi:hypothetical protein